MVDRPSADRTAEVLFWYARKRSRFEAEGWRRDAPRVDAEIVLKLALGRDVQFADASWIDPEKVDALGQAARAYVRHVFFRPDPTPYQVFGLEPGAPPETVKECFRLLMRLVHPDRQGEKRHWPDACAAQANWAYSMLRSQETRRTFEEEAEARAALQRAINRAAMAAEASQMPMVVWPKKSAKDRFSVPHQILPEWLTHGVGGYVRHHPAITAFGVLISVAALIVGISLSGGRDASLVRVARDERPAPAAVAPAPMPASEEPAAHATRPAESPPPRTPHSPAERPIVIASASANVEIARTAPERPAAQATSASPSAASGPSAASPVSSATAAGLPKSAADSPAVDPATLTTQTVAITDPTPPPAQSSAAIGAPAPAPFVAAAGVQPTATAAPPADAEVEALLAKFVDSYQRGRLDAFSALFDDDADTNLRHGRTAIRSEYDELFRLSQWRRMQLTRISWRPIGDRAVAKGELTVKIGWRDGREVEQRVNVDMELVRRDGRVVIAKLAHQPKNP
jgi:hypothetical protein